MTDDIVDIFQPLLKAIHHYYPLGYSGFTQYDGLGKIRELIEFKIRGLIAGDYTAWEKVIDQLKENFGDEVLDMNYMQFPCHQAMIEMGTESTDRYELKRCAIINISLLCPFYTIFFKDDIFFHGYDDGNGDGANISVVFSKDDKPGNKRGFLLEEWKTAVNRSFPEYNFVPHKFLFTCKIKGATLNNEMYELTVPQYPVYNFLFDPAFPRDDRLQVMV